MSIHRSGICAECPDERPIVAKNLCSACYHRRRRAATRIPCEAAGCSDFANPLATLPYCKPHRRKIEEALRARRAEQRKLKPDEVRPGSSLTVEQVHELRHDYAQGVGLVELSERYGISKPMVSSTAQGRKYAHIPPTVEAPWSKGRSGGRTNERIVIAP